MPDRSEISEQVARESQRRRSLAVPAVAGGVLYLLSGIVISATLRGAPSVGLFEGLAPAIRGVANPAVSPRAPEVKFISHHAFGLIAGSVMASISIAALTLVLLTLFDAARFRRPKSWPGFFGLVAFGGVALALVSIGHQVVSAIQAHNFATGHDLSNHAVDTVLTNGTGDEVTGYLDLLAVLAFMVGMIGATLNASRVGLLPRWMGYVGMFAAILFLPIGGTELNIVLAFWMVMIGILFIGKWPNGEPPAWADGVARPWPSRAGARARGPAGAPQPALSAASADLAPAPVLPASKAGGGKRRRKRGRRG